VCLPNVERAIIEPAKIRDYLLSVEHQSGRRKAAVFLALGYEAAAWERLAEDLRMPHLPLDAEPRLVDEYGQRYEIRGTVHPSMDVPRRRLLAVDAVHSEVPVSKIHDQEVCG
jgi:hypothetical protein